MHGAVFFHASADASAVAHAASRWGGIIIPLESWTSGLTVGAGLVRVGCWSASVAGDPKLIAAMAEALAVDGAPLLYLLDEAEICGAALARIPVVRRVDGPSALHEEIRKRRGGGDVAVISVRRSGPPRFLLLGAAACALALAAVAAPMVMGHKDKPAAASERSVRDDGLRGRFETVDSVAEN